MRICTLLLLLATALPVSAAAATSRPAAENSESFVEQLMALINDYRLEQGLSPLRPAAELEALALEHSDDMASQRVLTHEGFRTRYARSGSKVCVENLGWNHRTAQALLEGWRQSPSHHRNLLNPKVERVGIAARERYVTFFACR
jgi:uncharacterized protein YkwD